jgi:hypothetical protein
VPVISKSDDCNMEEADLRVHGWLIMVSTSATIWAAFFFGFYLLYSSTWFAASCLM